MVSVPQALVLVNGPPRSGKDAAGTALARALANVRLVKFADPLRVYVRDVLGVPLDDATKDAVIPELGISVRRAMIALSEEHLKPLLGGDIFGRLLRRRLEASIDYAHRVVVATDSGFAAEAEAVLDLVGRSRALLIRLHRPGCDFSRDSRSHFDLTGVSAIDLENSGTLPDFEVAVCLAVRRWLSELRRDTHARG